MKKLYLVIVGFISALLIISCENPSESKQTTSEKVRIFIAWPGYDYLPFYSWKKDEIEPSGLEVKLIKALLEKAKLKYVFVDDFFDFKNDPRIEVLTKDKADISIRCISITEERQKLVDFTTPYFYDGVGVMVLNSSNIHNENDLKNKRIFAVKYTTSYNWLTNEIKSFKYIVPNSEHFSKHMETMLDSDLVDAIVQDFSFLKTIKIQNKQYRLLDKKYTSEPWGIAVNKKRKNLLTILDSTLSIMNKSGELKTIIDEYNK